jgi:hypothetical protein
MPDSRPDSQPEGPRLRRGTKVETRDGPGAVAGWDRRKNTNGGPGTWQYVVRLDDGRIRRYGRNAVEVHQ